MALACLLCPASLGSLGEYAAHLQEDHRVHRLDVLNRMVGLQVQAEVKEDGLEENNPFLEGKAEAEPGGMLSLGDSRINKELECDVPVKMEDTVDKLGVHSEGQIPTEEVLTNTVQRNNKKVGKKCSDLGCEMVFKSLQALQNHERAKHGAEKLKCKEEGCGREFKSLLGFKMHEQTVHKEVGFKCEEEGCGRWFITTKRLEDHGRGQHGHAKLKCPEANCQGKFTTKENLKVHLKTIHSKDLLKGKEPKIIKCCEPGCKMMFRYRRNVKDHERAQHGVEKLKCKVEDCGKEYSSQMGYSLHVKHGHNKIRCDVEGCGKKFFTGQLLQAHHMSRHGQAKLKCPEEGCLREFTQKPNLRTHIKVVHKMEQFGCDNCSSKFNTKRQLQDHGREEHGHPKLACRVESCAQLFDKASYFYHHMKAQH